MPERHFNEAELRMMLEEATDIRKARRPGRFLIETRQDERIWHIVVEPQEDERVILVITAFTVE